jgi:PAS domain S-box-containing protein
MPLPSPREYINARVTVLVQLLLIVFIAELTVMELFSPLLARFNPVIAGLLDAALLATLYAVPLWFILTGALTASTSGYHLPVMRLLVAVLATLFCGQFLITLLLPSLLTTPMSTMGRLLDATLTVVVCAPFFWWIFARQLEKQLRAALAPPLMLYLLLLGAVFMFDLAEYQLIPYVFPQWGKLPYRFYDAFVTTLFVAPLLWWLMVRPLQRAALHERIRHEAVQSQVVDAVVNINTDGQIVSFNPAAQQIFGYSADEITGKSAAVLFCDDLLSPGNLYRLTEVAEGTPRLTHEVVCHHRDGSPLTMEISVSRLLLSNTTQYLVIMRDITARKLVEKALRESEIRFRQIFEQSDDAILFIRPGSGTIIDVNPTAERLFRRDRTELQAWGLAGICRSEDLAPLQAFITHPLQGAGLSIDRISCHGEDGAEFIVSLRGKIMSLQGVDIIKCSFRDITRRVRLEEEARTIQARLIQANKMTSLGLMVSGVAHEINNPNNYLLANAELLANCWEDGRKVLEQYYRENGDFSFGGVPYTAMAPQISELLAGIKDGSRRITAIINDLKGFARQEQPEAITPVDVNQVAKAAVSLLRYQIVNHTSNFHLELADSLPAISGNQQHLGQVIINLLMNACQALPAMDRGIRLVTGYDAAAGQVTITISDEGTGIPPEVMNRITEPFFTTKLDSGGTGLGLSISLAILKEHQATLAVESSPGCGSTFVIRLPASGHEPSGTETP